MTVPVDVRAEVEERVAPIRSVRGVGGGCINQAARLDTPAGPFFIKFNQAAPPGMFSAEAAGLEALREAARELRIPAVVAHAERWLALEWLEPGRRGPDFAERLGRGLALLHRSQSPSGWGFHEDGFIGSLPQSNGILEAWPEFWWRRRIEPQLRAAEARGMRPADAQSWERLRDLLEEGLGPVSGGDGASLLHGDLWSGNVMAAAPAEPALVDPAVYHGHREVDLAMTELFGGFEPVFYAAYEEVWPIEPGYREVRRNVYQLYYLLVHVNHFGGSYVPRTTAVLQRVLAAA